MRRTDQFDIYYLNKDDRLNFLFMAIKHPILGQFKDIRLYLAKWFFYDVLNVLDRLVELAHSRYFKTVVQERFQAWITEELNFRGNKGFEKDCSLFEYICKNPMFYKIFQKPWFWGCFLTELNGYDSIQGFVYIYGLNIWYVSDDNDHYDKCLEINSKQFLQLMDKLDNNNK